MTAPNREHPADPIPSEAEAIQAMRLVPSPRMPRRIARVLLAALAVMLVALLFVPWQQSVRGSGQVVAYAPLERQQVVQANIDGRVHRWGDGIREGVSVVKGQEVLEIRDIDPQALQRLEAQQLATREKLDATADVAKAYETKLNAVIDGQRSAIVAAEQDVAMAEQKVEAERQGLIAAEAAESQLDTYYTRQKQLLEEKLKSPQEVEIAHRKYLEAQAKREQAKAYLASALNGLAAKQAQLTQKQREAEGYIETARAEHHKALAELALGQKDLAEIEGKLAKQRNQIVLAPRDGTIVRLLANEGGEIVKSGDPLFVLVPETVDRAVEMWVSGNDVPLVSPGRHVRLQFEGWPAVQFAGWPSVAVGTFGGEVVNIDATDNGKGQFRLLVRPTQGAQWPDDRYLRQGVRANGWVLLNQVKLGYELWRQLNGFPPVVSAPEPKEEKGKKPPKVKM